MVRRPSFVVRRRPQCSNIFFSDIKAKFYVEPPWEAGMKICLRNLGDMTKMAATPIYGKNPSKVLQFITDRSNAVVLVWSLLAVLVSEFR